MVSNYTYIHKPLKNEKKTMITLNEFSVEIDIYFFYPVYNIYVISYAVTTDLAHKLPRALLTLVSFVR